MSNEMERQATPAAPPSADWTTTAKTLPGATTTAANPASSRGESIAKIGTVVSALMASSCCWLPVLLLAVGVSGAGIASALEAYRPIFMVVTFGFLGMAFYFTYRPRHAANAAADCCSSPAEATGKRRFNMMAFNKVMLWTVTLLAVVFLFFPQAVTGLLSSGSDEITADMTRTEIKVVGMTCYGWAAKAAAALHQAPGVLAVQVDYEKRLATIGTSPGQAVPRDEMLKSLKSIGYGGQFVD